MNKKDIKQAEEVNKLYSKLDKKEFAILMRWISDNCDIANKDGVNKEQEQILKIIDKVLVEDYKTTLKQFKVKLKQKIQERKV